VLFVVILGPAIIQIQDQMKSRDGQQATAPQTE
jgi:tight adherence protein C